MPNDNRYDLGDAPTDNDEEKKGEIPQEHFSLPQIGAHRNSQLLISINDEPIIEAPMSN